MGRASSVVLGLFALTLGSLVMGWVMFALANAARNQYRRWKRGRVEKGEVN